MLVVGYKTLHSQKESIRVEVENSAREFETRIKTGVGSVLYLLGAAGEIYKNRNLSLEYVKKVHEINAQGNFVLDIPVMANLTGFGGLEESRLIAHEMATSLALTKYFAIVKGLNSSFAQVYYSSKNHFSTRYPYVWSDQYLFTKERLEQAPWRYATPELNPEGKRFFTPLHKCVRKEKILVTIGHPVYNQKTFMGTVNLDISVADESLFLASKNLHNGTYVIINEEGEVVAADGLNGYGVNVIHQADQLIDSQLLNVTAGTPEFVTVGNDFVLVKSFKDVPWKLYYYTNQLALYMNVMFAMGPLLLVILLLFRVKTLIKRLAASRDEQERQALTDPMTQLNNRRYLSKITDNLLGLMRRNGSTLAVVMLDIDKFKRVNDTYGHKVGDDVIIKLAQTLKAHSRQSDVTCRLGGEEFVLLLPDTTTEGALKMAETLRKEVEEIVMKLDDDQELRFTISLGVSEVKSSEFNFDAGMNRADAALYEAKEGGRNRVCG